MEQQSEVSNPFHLFLANYAAPEHIPAIQAELERQHLPLDPQELKEIIASCATIGPGPFEGFGDSPVKHAQRVTMLHVVHMMCRSHHDEPWGDD